MRAGRSVASAADGQPPPARRPHHVPAERRDRYELSRPYVDVDPARYGGAPHDTVYAVHPVHPDRDDSELALAGLVVDRGTPALAICRGARVLNVALGGTLHVHLPDVVDGTVIHRQAPELADGMPGPTPHEVAVRARLARGRGDGRHRVTPMSWHHQAVDRPGDGLRAAAWAHDGTVEALEHDSHPWLAVVQWHPELTAGGAPVQQRLFDARVEQAAGSPGGMLGR